jgi:hypothetical protein
MADTIKAIRRLDRDKYNTSDHYYPMLKQLEFQAVGPRTTFQARHSSVSDTIGER